MKKILLFFVCLLITGAVAAQDGVSITHTLPGSITPGQTFDAEFTIAKGSIGGFAKFQMDLPFGFTAVNVDSKGGNFTYENQRVKIVWVSVPGDASFSFKFKITVPVNAVNACTVSSKFFYLENNVKKEAEMAAFTMKVYGGISAEVPATPVETVSTPTVETTPAVTSTPTVTSTSNETTSTSNETPVVTPVSTETVAATPKVTETPKEVVTSNPSQVSTSNAKTNTPSTAGTVYKVQLGAFSSSPSKSKFPGVSVTVVEEGGLYKVLTGNFSNAEQAHKHKNELIAKGYSGIVVIYQNGQRIGIQK